MEIIASGGVMRRCQKGSAKAGGLVFKRNDPPLSKIPIKHYERSGNPEALNISAGFRQKKVGLLTGD
jgi:hypothetical protein